MHAILERKSEAGPCGPRVFCSRSHAFYEFMTFRKENESRMGIFGNTGIFLCILAPFGSWGDTSYMLRLLERPNVGRSWATANAKYTLWAGYVDIRAMGAKKSTMYRRTYSCKAIDSRFSVHECSNWLSTQPSPKKKGEVWYLKH